MQCTKSEDIVAICLVLAEGDIQKSIEEILTRVENYQIKNNRHFGISRYDFRGLFYELGVTLGEISYSDILNGKAKKILREISLQSWLDNILEYKEAYFNDEGEYWIEKKSSKTTDNNLLISEYFGGRGEYQPEEILEFLREKEFNRDILYTCSRPGENS